MIVFVMSISAREGVGSPEGWLWITVSHAGSRWYTMEQSTVGGYSEPKAGIELGQGIGGCIRAGFHH
jgi:hypothetical protein